MMKLISVKFFLLTIIVLSVYLFSVYLFVEVWQEMSHSPPELYSVNLPHVVVHIDLKGAPPKLKYLESLLPLLKEHGANGLLMEYEDMFPYEGKLVNISAKNCYDRKDLKLFLDKAVKSGFEMIPLVQTFGHMEHVLKLQEFKHLREMPEFPDSICPSKNESKDLITLMLEQVIDFHADITPLKYIHLGGKDVYQINRCQRCTKMTMKNSVTSFRDIVTDHVEFLTSTVNKISPNTSLLLWNDMFHNVSKIAWEKHKMKNTKPVFWNYNPRLKVFYNIFDIFHKKFENIWIASAFKGADGRTATIPNLRNRFSNLFYWMNVIKNCPIAGHKHFYQFQGLILTGWSRYSHMDPLCELLPVSIPSLILNLLGIKKFKSGFLITDADLDEDNFFIKYLAKEFSHSLNCNLNVKFVQVPLNNFDLTHCHYGGEKIYNTVLQYLNVKHNIDVMLKQNMDGINFNFDNYSEVKRNINVNLLNIDLAWCNKSLTELVKIELNLVRNMGAFYEDDVINEFLKCKLSHTKKRLQFLIETLGNYSTIRVWDWFLLMVLVPLYLDKWCS